MNLLHWVIAVLLLLLGIANIFYNWCIIIQGIWGRQESWVPLLGGGAAAIGLLVIPVDGAASLWWIPLLVDFGSAPGLGYTLVWHVWRHVRRR